MRVHVLSRVRAQALPITCEAWVEALSGALRCRTCAARRHGSVEDAQQPASEASSVGLEEQTSGKPALVNIGG